MGAGLSGRTPIPYTGEADLAQGSGPALNIHVDGDDAARVRRLTEYGLSTAQGSGDVVNMAKAISDYLAKHPEEDDDGQRIVEQCYVEWFDAWEDRVREKWRRR